MENRKDLERLNFEQRKKLPSPSFDDPMGRYLGEGDDVEGVYEQFGA